MSCRGHEYTILYFLSVLVRVKESIVEISLHSYNGKTLNSMGYHFVIKRKRRRKIKRA